MAVAISVALPLYAQSAEIPQEKLKFVLIFSRHGVRTPTGDSEQLNRYSAQPWPKWDSPSGYLTPHGARLMTLFGSYYRAYLAQQGLLSGDGCADAAHVSFFSDSDQRTAETGKSLAAGMFPGCNASQQPAQHTLAEGQVDPLFHSLAAGVGQPDRKRAAASIAGRIGSNPAGVTEAYRLQLDGLQRLLLGCGGQFMQQFGGINALNYYFPIILTENIGLSELMARILTGCNATSYMISSGLCFWMIERFGRRSLMLTGLGLQCFSYIMVAIAIALLTDAPFQVSSKVCDGNRVLTGDSGEPLLSLSSLATTQHSAVLGEWFPGCIRQRSTHWRCELRAQLRRRQQIG